MAGGILVSGRGAAGLRELMESRVRPCARKAARSTLPCCRQLSSNRIFAPRNRNTCSPRLSVLTVKQQHRPFLNLAAPLFHSSKRMEYEEVHQLGYSVEQMYGVVADVASYWLFVPWCTSSRILSRCNEFLQAELKVGFPPVVEHYISEISLVPHHQIRAVSKDGRLFQHLETVWQFGPGLPNHPDSCTLSFYVSFEFKSVLHSQLAKLFFDEVVKQMVAAFEDRAEKLYGSQSTVRPHKALGCT